MIVLINLFLFLFLFYFICFLWTITIAIVFMFIILNYVVLLIIFSRFALILKLQVKQSRTNSQWLQQLSRTSALDFVLPVSRYCCPTSRSPIQPRRLETTLPLDRAPGVASHADTMRVCVSQPRSPKKQGPRSFTLYSSILIHFKWAPDQILDQNTTQSPTSQGSIPRSGLQKDTVTIINLV